MLVAHQCTEVRFASFLSGGFTTMVVINPPERKLAKRTSVLCFDRKSKRILYTCTCTCTCTLHFSTEVEALQALLGTPLKVQFYHKFYSHSSLIKK